MRSSYVCDNNYTPVMTYIKKERDVSFSLQYELPIVTTAQQNNYLW